MYNVAGPGDAGGGRSMAITGAVPGVEVRAPIDGRGAEIVTAEALAFVSLVSELGSIADGSS